MKWFAAIVILIASTSHAQSAYVCSLVFAERDGRSTLSQPTLARPTLARPIRELRRGLARLVAPGFKIADFNEAMANYRERGPSDLRQPETREEKLAFVRYLSEQSGRSPYDLEAWAKHADPKALSALARSMGKLDLDKGFSPLQIDALYAKLFEFSHSDPRTLKNLYRLGVQGIDRITLEQWLTKELASNDAVTAFQRMGLIKDQKGLQKVKDWMHAHPNAIRNINVASTVAVQMLLLKLPAPMEFPTYSALSSRKISPELEAAIETQGIDGAFPILRRDYGNDANFDHAVFWARRMATAAVGAILLAQLYPVMLNQVLPPGLVDDGSDGLTMTNAIFAYYGRVFSTLMNGGLKAFDDEEQKRRAPSKMNVTVSVDDTTTITADRLAIEIPDETRGTNVKKTSLAGTTKGSDGTTEAANPRILEDTLDQLNSIDIDDPTDH